MKRVNSYWLLVIGLISVFQLFSFSAFAQGPNVMVVNPPTRPVPVTVASGTTIIVPKGAAFTANGQVTTSTTAGTAVAARATRRGVTIKNLDATITVYVGIATVSATNGMELKAGESIPLDTTALIQVIAASGTPKIAFIETYD